MKTTNLNQSQSHSSSSAHKELMEMDINKIREFIKILEEHQLKCSEEGNFVEASLAKQRVAQFKKIEKKKLLKELKNNQENELNAAENQHHSELEIFNEDQDKKINDIQEKWENEINNLSAIQDNERQNKLEEFNKEFPENFKPSVELLNQNKIMEGLAKQKNYDKAHEVQTKIMEMTRFESEKWQKYREEKLRILEEKLKAKHSLEMSHLRKKYEREKFEFNKKRGVECEKLVQKYKNKVKELTNTHKLQINEFHNPLKGGVQNI